MVTPCHCPPTTFIGRSVQSAKTEPASLQPSRVASKKLVRRNSHATNAVEVCVDELNRQLWNDAPVEQSRRWLVVSLRSTSVNVHSTNCRAPRSSAYQSSPRKSSPSAGPQTSKVPPLRQ